MLRSSPARQATLFRAELSLLLLALPFAVQSSQQQQQRQQVQPSQEDPSTTGLRDPILWDESSLYKGPSAARSKRSASSPDGPAQQLVDACQSKMEILTPYYATNSKGKLRTVVNSELMQQAIQVETCARSPTSQSAAKCNAQLDCGCEQKYKWHRLLVLDPHDAGVSRGLFMDWFLFPSSCVCRCRSLSGAKQFLRNIQTRRPEH